MILSLIRKIRQGYCLIQACILVSCASCSLQSRQDGSVHVSDYINPFIGTSTNTEVARAYHGLGKTFPGATTPFGTVQVSPNTITGGDNGSGYSYEHETIEGFAFTQLSGIGRGGDLGNLLVMPTVGAMRTNSGKENGVTGYRSRYDKNSEEAGAGYYKVLLSDYKVEVEATATPHCGMLKFVYPKNEQSRIQIDLARRVGGTSTLQAIKVVDEHTISGKMECTPDGGGWGNGEGNANYTVYFYAQFSKPLKAFGVWSAKIPEGQNRKLEFVESPAFQKLTADASIIYNVEEYEGKHLGFFTDFETKEGEEVLFKSGISYVSEAGAEKNLKAEIADWNFEAVREQAREAWDEALSGIVIQGGTEEQKKIFYTSMYHSMIDPRNFTDVDGQYIGVDGKAQKWSPFICEKACHNESARYVLSACGLDPVCPVDTCYKITSPVFELAQIKVGDGKSFVIKANNNSAGHIYIQSAKLNGKKYGKCYLDYKDIMLGGVLELEMGETPNTSWGTI